MRTFALAVYIFAVGLIFAEQPASSPTILITPADTDYWNEAAKHVKRDRGAGVPNIIAPDAPVSMEMLENDGPGIQIINPKTITVHSPIELRVQFVPHDAAADPASVQVTAKKWILSKFRFEKDITDRVREYVSADGIHVPQAQLPDGRYQITLRVSDTNKKRSAGQIVLEIASGKG